MLPKKYRLSLRACNFPYNTYQQIDRRLFRAYLIKTASPQGAIIAAKKQFAKSTERNLVKRKLSQPLLETLKQVSQVSIVLWAKRPSLQASIEDIQNELQQLSLSIL